MSQTQTQIQKGGTLLVVGARRFLLPFFKSARQPSTQYALSLSLMMVEEKYDYIEEILTQIMFQYQN